MKPKTEARDTPGPRKAIAKADGDVTWDDFVIGMDGNAVFCHRLDFTNLQESLCGFGDTRDEALADLLRQEQEVKSPGTRSQTPRAIPPQPESAPAEKKHNS